MDKIKPQLFLDQVSDEVFLDMVPEDLPEYHRTLMERTAEERERELSEEEIVEIAKVALRWTEEFWGESFKEIDRSYTEPKLVLFSKKTRSACGRLSAKVTPVLYCPADEKVYLSPSFFNTMKKTHWAGTNDLSMAYVIFHEVSHHVQKLLGILTAVKWLQQDTSKADANRLNVALELHAEFLAGCALAGVHESHNIFHTDDPANLHWTVASMGDDVMRSRLQRDHKDSDAFTHGTARARTSAMWDGLTHRGWNKKERGFHFFMKLAGADEVD